MGSESNVARIFSKISPESYCYSLIFDSSPLAIADSDNDYALFTVQSLLEIDFFLQGPVPILKCLFPVLKSLVSPSPIDKKKENRIFCGSFCPYKLLLFKCLIETSCSPNIPFMCFASSTSFRITFSSKLVFSFT